MHASATLGFIEVLLPTCVAAILGGLLLKRTEEIKSAVARRSDFSQKWADLFFDASNEFMVSVEHWMACLIMLVNSTEPNGPRGMELQDQVNATVAAILENRYRVQRLALLAPRTGSDAEKAASDLFEMIRDFTVTKKTNVEELRKNFDEFNQAARAAHSEMIAPR